RLVSVCATSCPLLAPSHVSASGSVCANAAFRASVQQPVSRGVFLVPELTLCGTARHAQSEYGNRPGALQYSRARGLGEQGRLEGLGHLTERLSHKGPN